MQLLKSLKTTQILVVLLRIYATIIHVIVKKKNKRQAFLPLIR